MSKWTKAVLAVLPVAGVFAVLGATSAIATPSDGSHDFAVGGFERSSTPTNGGHTSFSAHSGPSGQDPSGQLSSTFDSSPSSPAPGQKERYRVVCLAVSGSDAALGLVPTDSPKTNVGAPRVLAVHDGGMPGNAGDLYAFYAAADPADCASYVGGGLFPTLHGNFLVHDEP
jgi:hypothetical protein